MFARLLLSGIGGSNTMVLSMIYKELYQQVGRSSNNGNEFPGIALILTGKEKHYHVKKTHRSQEDCRLMLISYRQIKIMFYLFAE